MQLKKLCSLFGNLQFMVGLIGFGSDYGNSN